MEGGKLPVCLKAVGFVGAVAEGLSFGAAATAEKDGLAGFDAGNLAGSVLDFDRPLNFIGTVFLAGNFSHFHHLLL